MWHLFWTGSTGLQFPLCRETSKYRPEKILKINPRRLERRVLCLCQLEPWDILTGGGRAGERGRGASPSWQCGGAPFVLISTLGDLAHGFEFRIREELPVLVLTTYRDWGNGPTQFLIWVVGAGGRASAKVGRWSQHLRPGTLRIPVLGNRSERRGKCPVSLFLWVELALVTILSHCPLFDNWLSLRGTS